MLSILLLTAFMATTGYEQNRPIFTVENSLIAKQSIGQSIGHATGESEIVEHSDRSKYRLQKYSLTDLAILENAFHNQVSNVQVLVLGRVIAVLPDDTNGDRHQRFIVKLSNSQTLLIAHNIDIAPRVDGVRVGDQLYIYGEYDWNSQGGVIHWTHHDPNGSHVAGWIERNGQVFQ